MTKAKILFYLRRHLKTLDEDSTFDMEDAANKRMSYAQRKAMIEIADGKKEETECIRKAVRFIEDGMDDVPTA